MHAPLPVAHLLFAVSVVEREHRRGMLRLHESLARLAAHALCRRVRSDQLRMLRLDPLELVHQRVELGIRNLRIVQHVIAILVVPYLLAQSFDFLLDGGTGHDWGIIVRGEVPSTRRCGFTGYWVLATRYCLFAFRIRPRPTAPRPTLDGGFFIPSSNSLSTIALLCSSSRDAYNNVTCRLPSAR